MKLATVLSKAVSLYNLGNLGRAISLLTRCLQGKDEASRHGKLAKATLYLGTLYRFHGRWDQSIKELRGLAESGFVSPTNQAHAYIQLANTYKSLLKYDQSEVCLERANSILCSPDYSEDTSDWLKASQLYHSTLANLLDQQGRSEEALVEYQQSLDILIGLQSVLSCKRALINIYLNLYNCRMILGHSDTAIEYLTLAHAQMQTLESPYAYGLIQFFENMAIHNLMAAGSPRAAIKALTNISEEVVSNFADFRKIFDFFSSIIVQLHEGKIYVEEIRKQIKEYGDDPLIKAYIPTLLYGAPPPGSDNGDYDTPAARLTD